jgi:Bifunctional DNA primase/polymerase, N-terminal
VAAVADGSRNLRAALTYARAGWRVFPAIPGEKVPATAHGVHDATADQTQIRAWWERNPDRNVAIACGEPGPDVLDIDRKPAGSGFPALRKLRQAGLIPTPQALVRTPNGGAHLYFAPTPSASNGSVPSRMIDHRGAGGYVVAPPSEVRRAVDGQPRPYVVVHHQASADRINWAAIRQHLDPQPERTWEPPAHLRDGAQQNLDHLPAFVARQEEGNRNAALFWAANRLLDHGQAERLGELAGAARQAGASPREIERTIRSAQQQPRQDPHVRTPRDSARLAGPEPRRQPQSAARREAAQERQRAPVAVLEMDRDDPGIPIRTESGRAPARPGEAGQEPGRDAMVEPEGGRTEPGAGGAERQEQPEREMPGCPFAHPGIEQPEREAGG